MSGTTVHVARLLSCVGLLASRVVFASEASLLHGQSDVAAAALGAAKAKAQLAHHACEVSIRDGAHYSLVRLQDFAEKLAAKDYQLLLAGDSTRRHSSPALRTTDLELSYRQIHHHRDDRYSCEVDLVLNKLGATRKVFTAYSWHSAGHSVPLGPNFTVERQRVLLANSRGTASAVSRHDACDSARRQAFAALPPCMASPAKQK